MCIDPVIGDAVNNDQSFSDCSTHSSLDHLHTLVPHVSDHSRHITIPSFSTCFRIMSMAINVPVRPTPALYDNRVLITSSCSTVHLPAVNTMGPFDGLYSFLMRWWKARMGVPYSGTPWSGQEVKWYCVIMRGYSELLPDSWWRHARSMYNDIHYTCPILTSTWSSRIV